MPDRAALIRYSLGELLIGDVYTAQNGVCVSRLDNRRYAVTSGNVCAHKARINRKAADAALWELAWLVLQLESVPGVADKIIT